MQCLTNNGSPNSQNRVFLSGVLRTHVIVCFQTTHVFRSSALPSAGFCGRLGAHVVRPETAQYFDSASLTLSSGELLKMWV